MFIIFSILDLFRSFYKKKHKKNDKIIRNAISYVCEFHIPLRFNVLKNEKKD